MPDVNISYKGSQIASMEGSGVKTLLTSGKYCEDDIFVSYNKIGNATAEGDSSVSVTDAESGNICSLIQYGVCEQDAQTNAISCNNGTLSVSSGEIVTTAANREAIALGSQTATVENLYSVGNVRDEQELVTGTVTRKNAACIYDGTQPVGDRYISSTGAKDNGAIIIYPLETEHTGDSIVSFTETVKQDVNSLEARIEPIQDLHGYSSPWPAGGGANKFGVADATDLANGTSRKLSISDGLMTVTSTGGISSTVIIGQSILAQVIENATLPAGTYYFKIFDYSSTVTGATADGIRLRISTNGTNTDYAWNTAFTLSADSTIVGFYVASALQWNSGNTMKLRVAISSTNVDSWTPYSNICPISGRTGLDVYRTGINIWDEEWERGTIGLTTGAKVDDNTKIRSKNYVPISPNTAYYYKFPGNWRMIYFDADKNVVEQGNTYSPNIILTSPATAHYLLFALDGTTEYDNNIAINYPATDHDYHAYNGNTYAVDWTTEAGTVYGCHVNPVTGVLTVDYIKQTITSVNLWGFSNPNGTPVYVSVSGTNHDPTKLDVAKMKSNIFTYTQIGASTSPLYSYGANSGASETQTFILPSSVTTKAEANAWFEANPTECIFKLATPLTYQLTPTQVEALVGTNNIFSPDATSIKVAVSNPVIEYVAPQPFTLAEGSNTVSATNLSVSFVPLELNYISKAAQPTSVAKKDVNFIDYDGTLLYSYTASEFANLSALPANPSHEGLVAQGWNWSLADAKTYVASYGKLWIGQMYITESGDTEIDIELHAPRLSPWLSLAINGTVEVDWGDGTAKSTVTGTDTDLTTQIMTPHAYATDGSYTIKIHVVSGSFSLCGSAWNSVLSGNFSSNSNNVYSSAVQRVRIGSSTSSIGRYTFGGCSSLTSITIPSGVTSIGNSAFSSCRSLTSITIPSEVTSIGNSMFNNCSSLTSITIPSGVTSIGIEAFYYCFTLASIMIPSEVTSIRDRTFYDCYSLTSITIPNEVTSMGTDAFYYCYAFASITIPSGVTSINNRAFQSCSGLGLIRFEPTTPPTVSNSNAWTSIPTDCIILIPYNSDSYIEATNYPSSSTYHYVGYMTSVSGESLPTQTTSMNYTLTWYATKEEAASRTGTQLTQGNGNEIYCRYTAS